MGDSAKGTRVLVTVILDNLGEGLGRAEIQSLRDFRNDGVLRHQQNLAEVLVGLHVGLRLGRLVERKHLVDR